MSNLFGRIMNNYIRVIQIRIFESPWIYFSRIVDQFYAGGEGWKLGVGSNTLHIYFNLFKGFV